MTTTFFRAIKKIGSIGRNPSKIIENYKLLLDWAVGYSEHNLSLIEEVLSISLSVMPKTHGIIILETDPDQWHDNEYTGSFLHISAMWPKSDSYLFPAWILKSHTRAASVLTDAPLIDDASADDFFIQQNAHGDHPRRSYYRHPADKKLSIDDGLFDMYNKIASLNRINGVTKIKIKPVVTSIFTPINLASRGKGILCFYSCEKREYDADFYAKNIQIMALLRQAFNFTLPGISFRLISAINQILTDEAGADINEENLQRALDDIPQMIADFLCCRDVVIKFNKMSDLRKNVYSTPDDLKADFISFIDACLMEGGGKLEMNPVGTMQQAPPLSDLSFSRLAEPILLNGRPLAVIACQGRQGAPYVLTGWERDLLAIIGSHIARAWSEVQAKRRLGKEKDAWRQAVSIIAAANARGYRALGRGNPELDWILRQLLVVIEGVIGSDKGRCWLSVRLLDSDERFLRYEVFLGKAWERLPQLKRQTYSTSPNAAGKLCLGAWAVQKQQYWHSKNVNIQGELPDSVSIDDAGDEQFIVIPIMAGSDGGKPKCLGVIDIHMPQSCAVPDHFRELATVIGHQMGLFIQMTTKVKSIVDDWQAVKIKYREADEYRRLNIEVMQNLHHQVDSPMVLAMREMDRMLDHFRTRISEFNQLRAIRAFVRRSWQASSSADIMRTITTGRSVGKMFDLKPMTATNISMLLQDVAEDFRHVIDAGKRIKIEVNDSGYAGRDLSIFQYNEKMLNQVIGNLMDNAAKYSFEGSAILISGGLTKNNSFYISIRNRGLPIRSAEIQKMKERGYRSETAQYFAEGTGIGLWLVDQIMQRFGGVFEIIPANNDKEYHTFRVIFTAKRADWREK
jgi:signal transduction histidine kinase